MQAFLNIYLDDKVIFPLVELCLLLILGFALGMQGKMYKNSIVTKVTRGEESWGYFAFAYSILSVIFIELVSVSSALNNYKVFFILLNLSILLYLCFFSSWFRNKIVLIMSISKN